MSGEVQGVSELLPVPDLGLHPEPVAKGARCEAHGDRGAIFRCAICKSDRCEACLFGKLGAREICRTCAKDGLPRPIPWELRHEQGVVRTFVETVRLVCFSPIAFFRTPALEDDAVGAFELGLVCFALGQLAVVSQVLLFSVIGSSVVAIGSHMPALVLAAGGYGCVLLATVPTMIVHVPVTAILSVGTASLGTHGTLKLFGAARAPFFSGTVRGMSYAFATQVFMLVPVVGVIVSIVWMLAIETIALREAHRTSTALAIVAVLGFRVLFYGGIALGYAALVAMALMNVTGR
jgi:hypothetical protein